MSDFPWVAVLVAYAVGSIPTAYIAGRALKGVDLRTVGSGNLGATNVYRELGTWPALAVLFADAAKGALPILLFRHSAVGELQQLALAAAAILGHAKPAFLGWRGGGKGVATTAGAFAAIAPIPLVGALVAFSLAVGLTRWISLGSMVGATVLPLLLYFERGGTELTGGAATIGAFVIWLHRANIRRIIAGTEPRFTTPGSAKP